MCAISGYAILGYAIFGWVFGEHDTSNNAS
jgi:hypothetical protein